MLSLDWAEGSGEAQSPYKRAGKLRNTTVAVLETVPKTIPWARGGVGLAKNLLRFTLPSYRKPKETFWPTQYLEEEYFAGSRSPALETQDSD